MRYQFLAPLMEQAGIGPVSGWRHVPEIQQTQLFDVATAHALTDVVLAAHQAGHSFGSRTRYVEKSGWDVNKQFRSSKNLPSSTEGLGAGFDAMQRYAEQSMAAFGLSADTHVLQPMEDQCLIYEAGDYVCDHADDSALYEADDGQQIWRPVKPHRHLVGIVWLTSRSDDMAAPDFGQYTFSGGELRVNSLVDTDTGAPLTVDPQAGIMALFPANPWFRHEVLPVHGGMRVALTRWWQVRTLDGDDA